MLFFVVVFLLNESKLFVLIGKYLQDIILSKKAK